MQITGAIRNLSANLAQVRIAGTYSTSCMFVYGSGFTRVSWTALGKRVQLLQGSNVVQALETPEVRDTLQGDTEVGFSAGSSDRVTRLAFNAADQPVEQTISVMRSLTGAPGMCPFAQPWCSTPPCVCPPNCGP